MSKDISYFPDGFVWGVATSAHQIEGGVLADGKGLSMWDAFSRIPKRIVDGSNGDVACDSYHQLETDIKLLKELGVSHYRFSIAWSRILPDGVGDTPNAAGIEYYNRIIDGLLEAGIQPFVTLYHWDLPLALHYLGGWTNPSSVQWFENYAHICFQRFGDRVKRWVTFNQPHSFVALGYGNVWSAPAFNDPLFLTSQACHNVIRAHVKAYRLYNKLYRTTQKGLVGISCEMVWLEPKDATSQADIEASQRCFLCTFARYTQPIFGNGDYPEVLKSQMTKLCQSLGLPLSAVLPSFTQDEIQENKGSADFFALNYYTSRLCSELSGEAADFDELLSQAHPETDPAWKVAASFWLYVVPWGLRKLLNWISAEYNSPVIFITENGYSDKGLLNDADRIDSLKSHLIEASKAITIDKCNLQGYFAWSLLDNFEWGMGYTEKFGLYHVDFTDPTRKRTARDSAKFYANIIANNHFVN